MILYAKLSHSRGQYLGQGYVFPNFGSGGAIPDNGVITKGARDRFVSRRRRSLEEQDERDMAYILKQIMPLIDGELQ